MGGRSGTAGVERQRARARGRGAHQARGAPGARLFGRRGHFARSNGYYVAEPHGRRSQVLPACDDQRLRATPDDVSLSVGDSGQRFRAPVSGRQLRALRLVRATDTTYLASPLTTRLAGMYGRAAVQTGTVLHSSGQPPRPSASCHPKLCATSCEFTFCRNYIKTDFLHGIGIFITVFNAISLYNSYFYSIFRVSSFAMLSCPG